MAQFLSSSLSAMASQIFQQLVRQMSCSLDVACVLSSTALSTNCHTFHSTHLQISRRRSSRWPKSTRRRHKAEACHRILTLAPTCGEGYPAEHQFRCLLPCLRWRRRCSYGLTHSLRLISRRKLQLLLLWRRPCQAQMKTFVHFDEFHNRADSLE